MLHHRKLNKWVPPGGKIEPHEIPEEAAIRECYEETGIAIKLLGEKSPVDGGLLPPRGLQLNPIIPNQCDHIDLIYLSRPTGSETLQVSEREAHDIGWFSLEEILNLNTFPSVIRWCDIFRKEA